MNERDAMPMTGGQMEPQTSPNDPPPEHKPAEPQTPSPQPERELEVPMVEPKQQPIHREIPTQPIHE